MREKAEILDEIGIGRAITRISHEILESNKGTEHLILIGIFTRGVFLARRIADKISDIEGVEIPVGTIDITRNRDDSKRGSDDKTDIRFDVTGQHVVLVDDVIYTGRSARAAIDTLMALGRPRTIRLAALVDRGHREIPFRADFVGKNLPTSRSEIVKVQLKESDGRERVVIYEMGDEVNP